MRGKPTPNQEKHIPALVKRIEQWPIERLIPYARNARTHSAAQVAQISGSIREFGFNNPVLVDSQAGIIAGHGRVLAARKLGLTEVPVIVLDHLSDTQKRAYILADNKLAENAGWDDEMLALELKALSGEGVDPELIGFAEDELLRLLGEVEGAAGLTDEDAVPDVAETVVSKPGDLWVLGDHRVLCGDATRREDIDRVLEGGLGDMTFCDPPYNVAYESRGRKITNDNLGTGFAAFLRSSCENVLAVTKGAVYICMSSSELDTLKTAFQSAGGHWSTFVIWAKNTFTLGRSDYQRQYEPILYGWKEGTKHFWCGARDQGDIWFVNKPVNNHMHPTTKPVELVERAIQNSSKSRDTILDPFGGSGTTLIACERTGRQARLIELEPKYVDVIVNRWQQYSGKAAWAAAGNKRFDEFQKEGHGGRQCPPA